MLGSSTPDAGPSRLSVDDTDIMLSQEQRQRLLRTNKKLERILGTTLPSSCIPPSFRRTVGLAGSLNSRNGPQRRLQRQRTLPSVPTRASCFLSEEFTKSSEVHVISEASPVAEGVDEDGRLSRLRRPVPPMVIPHSESVNSNYENDSTNTSTSLSASVSSSTSPLASPSSSRKPRLRRKSLSIATLDVGHDAGSRSSRIDSLGAGLESVLAPLTAGRCGLERSGSLGAPRPLPTPPVLKRGSPQRDIATTQSQGEESLRRSNSSSSRSSTCLSRQGSARRLPLAPVLPPMPLTRSSSVASSSTAHSVTPTVLSVLCDNTNNSGNSGMSSPPSPISPSSPSSAEILRRKRTRMAKLMRVLGESPPCHLVFSSENYKHEPSPIREEAEEDILPRKRTHAHAHTVSTLKPESKDDMTSIKVTVDEAPTLTPIPIPVDITLSIPSEKLEMKPSPVEPSSPITFAPGVVTSSPDYASRRMSAFDPDEAFPPSRVKNQNVCWVRQQVGRNRQFVEVHDYGNVVRALREL